MKPKNPKLEAFWQSTLRGTAIAIVIVLIFFLMTSLTVDYVPAIDVVAFLTLVAFSLAISYAREIFRIPSLSAPVKWALNFITNAVACFLVLLITTKAFAVGLVIYVVIYAIVAAASALLHRLFPHEDADPSALKKENYTNRFS